MSVITHESGDRLGKTEIGLAVSVSGMDISVGAGAFKIGGTEYELAEGFSHTLGADSDRRSVEVYLGREKDGARAVVVMVDEVKAGDAPFDWDGSDYEALYRLAFATVPGDTTDLADVDIHAVNVVVREEEREEPVEPVEPEEEG